jgi:uncharacterized BrkB/YihY/UPF0761 family membrane protein
MESICVGAFLLVFLAIASLFAASIAVAIGVAVEKRQNHTPSNERRSNAIAVGIIIFILLMIGACIILLVWNPNI